MYVSFGKGYAPVWHRLAYVQHLILLGFRWSEVVSHIGSGHPSQPYPEQILVTRISVLHGSHGIGA